MSIIYDALKKVQVKTKDIKEDSGIPEPSKPKFPRRIIYILCILIVLGFISLFVENPFTEKSFIDRSVIPPPTPGKPPAQEKRLPTEIKPLPVSEKEITPSAKKLPSLSLTGIFFSDGEYLALINDKIVKVGDFFEGAQIQKIDSSGVEIKFEGSSFQLNYP